MDDAGHPRLPAAPPLLFAGVIMLSLVLQALVPVPSAAPEPMRWLGLSILCAAAALGWAALFAMRRAQTSPRPSRPATTLVTGGPFRLSRNPIYLGYALAVIGMTMAAGSLWGVLMTPLTVVAATRWLVQPEERYLEARFGEAYRAYMKRTRRWV